VNCGWVKIRWVDEEFGDGAVALHACVGSGGLSCDSVKGIDCSVDVW